MTDQPDLQQRIADAIARMLEQPNGMAYRGMLPDAVLAVVQPELSHAHEMMQQHYEAAQSARAELDQLLGDVTEMRHIVDQIATQRDELRQRLTTLGRELEQARAAVQHVRQIADRWDKYGTTDLRTAARILRTDVLDGPVADQQPTTEGDPQ